MWGRCMPYIYTHTTYIQPSTLQEDTKNTFIHTMFVYSVVRYWFESGPSMRGGPLLAQRKLEGRSHNNKELFLAFF